MFHALKIPRTLTAISKMCFCTCHFENGFVPETSIKNHRNVLRFKKCLQHKKLKYNFFKSLLTLLKAVHDYPSKSDPEV